MSNTFFKINSMDRHLFRRKPLLHLSTKSLELHVEDVWLNRLIELLTSDFHQSVDVLLQGPMLSHFFLISPAM